MTWAYSWQISWDTVHWFVASNWQIHQTSWHWTLNKCKRSLVPNLNEKYIFCLSKTLQKKSIAHIPGRVLTVNLITPCSAHVEIIRKRLKETTICDSQTEWTQTSFIRWTTSARPSRPVPSRPVLQTDILLGASDSCRSVLGSFSTLRFLDVRSARDSSCWGIAILKMIFFSCSPQ